MSSIGNRLATCPQCGAAIPVESSTNRPSTCAKCGAAVEAVTASSAADSLSPTDRPADDANTDSDRADGSEPPSMAGFTFERLIGQGGMGEVWLARQNSLGRLVAVKLLSPQMTSSPKLLARFEQEARAMARLSHPNIVTVHEFTADTGQCSIVMEYVGDAANGSRDLSEVMRVGSLDVVDVRDRICEVLSALHAAHAEGIIHRDVKPANVMLDRAGHAKLVDFGIAACRAATDRSITAASSAMGTQDYMAPEQARDAQRVDHRADLYATGVMLYEMLTGDLPQGAFKPCSERVDGLSPAWDEVVNRALQANPEDRFPDAVTMRDVILAIPVEGAVPSLPAGSGTPRGTSLHTQPDNSCYQCQQAVGPDEQFCPNCGTSLRVTCRKCGTTVSGGKRFCPGCGDDLSKRLKLQSYLAEGASAYDAAANEHLPLRQRFEQVEQAHILAAKALSICPDDPDAAEMAGRTKRLGLAVAKALAVKSVKAKGPSKDLDLAMDCVAFCADIQPLDETLTKIRDHIESANANSAKVELRKTIDALTAARKFVELQQVLSDHIGQSNTNTSPKAIDLQKRYAEHVRNLKAKREDVRRDIAADPDHIRTLSQGRDALMDIRERISDLDGLDEEIQALESRIADARQNKARRNRWRRRKSFATAVGLLLLVGYGMQRTFESWPQSWQDAVADHAPAFVTDTLKSSGPTQDSPVDEILEGETLADSNVPRVDDPVESFGSIEEAEAALEDAQAAFQNSNVDQAYAKWRSVMQAAKQHATNASNQNDPQAARWQTLKYQADSWGETVRVAKAEKDANVALAAAENALGNEDRERARKELDNADAAFAMAGRNRLWSQEREAKAIRARVETVPGTVKYAKQAYNDALEALSRRDGLTAKKRLDTATREVSAAKSDRSNWNGDWVELEDDVEALRPQVERLYAATKLTEAFASAEAKIAAHDAAAADLALNDAERLLGNGAVDDFAAQREHQKLATLRRQADVERKLASADTALKAGDAASVRKALAAASAMSPTSDQVARMDNIRAEMAETIVSTLKLKFEGLAPQQLSVEVEGRPRPVERESDSLVSIVVPAGQSVAIVRSGGRMQYIAYSVESDAEKTVVPHLVEPGVRSMPRITQTAVERVGISGDGDRAISLTGRYVDDPLISWELEAMKPTSDPALRKPYYYPDSLTVSPSGDRLAFNIQTSRNDGRGILVRSMTDLAGFSIRGPIIAALQQRGDAETYALRFAPYNENRLLAASVIGREHYLSEWDLESKTQRPIVSFNNAISAIAYSNDESTIFVSSGDRNPIVQRWSRVPEKHWTQYEGQHYTIIAMHSYGSPERLASVSGRRGYDGEVVIWDAASGDLVRRFSLGENVSCADFSSDGQFVVVGYRDGQLAVFDLHGSTDLPLWRTWPPNREAMYAVALSADRTTAVSGHSEGYVNFWRLPIGVAPDVEGVAAEVADPSESDKPENSEADTR